MSIREGIGEGEGSLLLGLEEGGIDWGLGGNLLGLFSSLKVGLEGNLGGRGREEEEPFFQGKPLASSSSS